MNPLKRFVEFISTPGHRRTITALVILIIAAAVPLTVLVAQQQQNTSQKAAVVSYVTCQTSSYTGVCSATACSGAGATINATCLTYSAGTKNYCCPATVTTTPSPTPSATCIPVPCCYFTIPKCQLPMVMDKYCPITNIPPSYCTGNTPSPTPVPTITPSPTPVCLPITGAFPSCAANNTCTVKLVGATWYYCVNPTPVPTSTPKPTTLPTATPITTLPDCNSGLSCNNSCTTSKVNTCSNNGTKTCTYSTSTTGGLCNPKNVTQTCNANNCSSGYTCNSSGSCIAQATVSPTASTTSTPTSSPNPSGSPTPTQSSSPTPTPIPGNTYIALVVGMDGVGKAGTHQNPIPAGTQNPAHPQRSVTVRVLDNNNNVVVNDKIGTINYNATSGLFAGNFDLGNTFTTGNYTVRVKSDGHLRKTIPGIQVITAGIANPTLPRIDLTAGDINGDNLIDIKDYNILLSCMADPDINNPDGGSLCNTNAAFKTVSDLDDNGTVDKFDYNLFLGEYSVQNGD